MAKKDDPAQGRLKQEIEKLKDQALNVFNALVQEAVEKMDNVDDDLKQRLAEELKKSEKDIKALDQICRDTQTKINQVMQEAVQEVDESWHNSRDEIQTIISETHRIFGLPTIDVDQLTEEVENQIRDFQRKLEEAAERQNAEVAKLIDDSKKKKPPDGGTTSE